MDSSLIILVRTRQSIRSKVYFSKNVLTANQQNNQLSEFEFDWSRFRLTLLACLLSTGLVVASRVIQHLKELFPGMVCRGSRRFCATQPLS